jgi:phosphoglycerol transferase MdoB-like AlkP superfamily enzyme
MVLFSLSRIGFYIFNHNMFPGIPTGSLITILKGGLLFDISAVVYINMIFIFLHIVPFDIRYNNGYQLVLKYVFFITNGIALAFNGADYVYYRFIFKRATADIFRTFENENNLVRLFFRFLIDYWPATLFFICLMILMVYLYSKVKVSKPDPKSRILYFLINIAMIPVVIALVAGGARGGYKHSTRPITISNAAKYAENTRDVALVLNTPFSLIRTYNKKVLKRYNFFEEKKVTGLYNPHYVPVNNKPFSSLNVIIIILESFSREYVGSLNTDLEGGKYTGYTPFLDSLISVSLTFDVSLASGLKSIDAMPSVFASVPSLETPYTISHYANNNINGIAGLLKRKGYYTAFFHGAPNGSMGFDSFARMAGFDEYFGLDQYPDKNDFDGMWGVWDEPFLKFFAGKIDHFREPFLASVYTISSHHPFKVPEKYTGKFKKGPVPVVEAVGYTDYALKEFFNEISNKPWFDNTLFVITADHPNERIHREFQNNFGGFCVPILFYKHKSNLLGMKKRIAQHIDIMPSVLSYLNFDEEFIAFGNNLFDDSYESFGFNTVGNDYQLFMKDHLLDMIDNKPVGFYNFKTDRFLETNELSKDTELLNLMEDKLKAIIQTYNNRLIDNNMVVRKER